MSDHLSLVDHPLWQYSLVVYKQPAVQQTCLPLQDEHGLQVNLLLAAGWLGKQSRCLPETGWQALMAATADWQRQGIQPLRAWRRRLPADTDTAFRQQALKLELQAEALEQQTLWHCLRVAVTQTVSDSAEAIHRNLHHYWQVARPAQAEPALLLVLADALHRASA